MVLGLLIFALNKWRFCATFSWAADDEHLSLIKLCGIIEKGTEKRDAGHLLNVSLAACRAWTLIMSPYFISHTQAGNENAIHFWPDALCQQDTKIVDQNRQVFQMDISQSALLKEFGKILIKYLQFFLEKYE